ncbi:hypothetical protein [Aquisalimonas asiatica]|uniref:Membrane domain of glycerophosphoryl diester phosphodiesterase n=1 Tax=Aquisalimonas asiatica TaxID=406100 RepID=A0A1H8UG54_9GAMM|nr:hypothetical protein [Aquisalimonas asiatica]SEP01854.1 hypothetical protein SAMN04488052_106164 [Aquisalimonas asiatica]
MNEPTLTGDQSPAPRGLIAAMGWTMGLLARHWWRLTLFGGAVLAVMIALHWVTPVSRSAAFVSAFLLTQFLHVFALMAGLRLLYNWEHGITPWWRIGALRLLLPAIGVTVLMQLMLWAISGLLSVVLKLFGLPSISAITHGAPVLSSGAFSLFAVVVIVLAIVLTIISVRMVPWVPLMSLRRLGVIAALKRAWSLTFDSWWFTALLALFYAALTVGAEIALEAGLYALPLHGYELFWWIMMGLAQAFIAFSIALVVPVGYVLVHSLEAREATRLEQLRPVSRNRDQ